jgi:NAD+--asparagine ADP-ribosyltransferase
VASSKIKSSQLLEAARASLVLTCKQSGGAANKVVTIAGVIFATASTQMSGDMARYAEMTANYRVSNSIALPLTLAGTNKIITIADAA